MADVDLEATTGNIDPEAAAAFTRTEAEGETKDQRTPEGTHGFPTKGDGSDDITGQAPASSMAQQKTQPARD